MADSVFVDGGWLECYCDEQKIATNRQRQLDEDFLPQRNPDSNSLAVEIGTGGTKKGRVTRRQPDLSAACDCLGFQLIHHCLILYFYYEIFALLF